MYRRLGVESLRLEALGLTHISQEAASLRQLAQTQEVGPLHVLASVLEPVAFHERAHMQHPNQLTALNQLVDALSPDPPSRHNFELLVRNYLQGPTTRLQEETGLATSFKAWIAAQPGILHLMAGWPKLTQAVSRTQQLTALGTVGMSAISYLSSGLAAPSGWKAQQISVLDEAEKPQALVRFTVIKPLRDLVNAVPEPAN